MKSTVAKPVEVTDEILAERGGKSGIRLTLTLTMFCCLMTIGAKGVTTNLKVSLEVIGFGLLSPMNTVTRQVPGSV